MFIVIPEMFEATEEVIRSHQIKKARQHNGLELEDTKEVIRSHQSFSD
jgi:hypothetical protein